MDFEQLAAEYSSMINSIIHTLHIYKNQEDYYQIGLITLWNASQTFDESKGKFSNYAYTSIKGKLLDQLKKENKWEDSCFYLDKEYWSGLKCEIKLLEMENLLSHFYHLTDRQKKWVILRFYYGLSNRDIAEMENISLRKVRAWGDLAMKKFIRSTR